MKKELAILSMSLALAAPLSLTQIALAQVTPAAVVVAQNDGMEAYLYSGYSYFDAMVLANFWGVPTNQAKARIGTKILGGQDSKAYLSLTMTEARCAAIANAGFLKLYNDAGYSYSDAQDLAKFWGDRNILDAKLRVEKNLALGNYDGIQHVLKLARRAR